MLQHSFDTPNTESAYYIEILQLVSLKLFFTRSDESTA